MKTPEDDQAWQEIMKKEKVPISELTTEELQIISENRNPIAYCGYDCRHCLGWVRNLCWNFEEYRGELNQEDEKET